MFCPSHPAEWVPPTSDTGSFPPDEAPVAGRSLPPAPPAVTPSLPALPSMPLPPSVPRRRPLGPRVPHRQAPGGGPIPPAHPARLADRRRSPAPSSTHASPVGGGPRPRAPALNGRTSAADFCHKIRHHWSPAEQFLAATSFAELLWTSSVPLRHRFAAGEAHPPPPFKLLPYRPSPSSIA
ncbi:hypothetical protein PAHAL_4G301500 [Panicum hallii]|jgi:hypothetical protein|uniref:Uncharacterized protein n=1 Tax=Panicum hallii TaxID=206008 RepID=A0A2T8JEG4_9POAL|nr:hypothetical protein PAHAL_4G301500 [Panicum hallii]